MKSVKEIIAETLRIPIEQVTNELTIGEIPQWNSMANIAIIAAIEKELQLEIPIEDLFELTDVASIEQEVKRITNASN